MLQKNQIVELDITGLTHEGNGVGRWEGMAVFVPRTAPGDRLEVRIAQVRTSYAYGIPQRLIVPSPRRVENDCPVFARCGGCALRHIEYPAELEAKAGWVRDNMTRIGKLALDWEPILPSPAVERYRNKAQYPIRLVEGRVRAGFFAPRSHRLIPAEDCLLQPAYFSALCREVCAFAEEHGLLPYEEEGGRGLLRHLLIRRAQATEQTLVCLVINGGSLPHGEELARRLAPLCPGEMTLCLSENTGRDNVILGRRFLRVAGPGWIEDELAGVSLRLSPGSFYQVNREAARLLYGVVAEYAGYDPERPAGVLLDLYCGAGAIGLSLAAGFEEVVGVEEFGAAVEDAAENALRSGVANARFLCADAAKAAAALREENAAPKVVVVDPPRKGVAPAALGDIAGMGPQRIVYVSCDSATLARDCRILGDYGYRPVRGRAVDLFPRTAHVETVVLLSRKMMVDKI